MKHLVALAMSFTLLFALFAPATISAQADAASAADAALVWMRDQQQADGSFLGFGPGDSADAVFALVAAGEDPAAVQQDGNSALDYLSTQASGYATSVGAAAKLVMAAVAGNQDPTSFGGVDLLAVIGKGYDPTTGQYGPDVFGHALALLALKSVGVEAPAAAVDRLLALQLPDGGWSFDGTADTGSDTNTTALAIQALADNSAAQDVVDTALAYLKTQQNDDGGFPYSQTSSFGSDSDANSTAYVLQALAAAGADAADSDWTAPNGDPLSTLVGLQNDSGAMRYQATAPDDNALATYQAVAGLLSRPLPVATTTVVGAEALLIPAASLPATGTSGSHEWLLAMALILLIGGLAVVRGHSAQRTAHKSK
ncbi:terpene cyclase/mutase family protein [Candidatus Gracilibacteria bacterium]|nr:terpene cyclase/mutase family protein [Candidatus Gracilibacteria bacterium]